MNKVESRSRNLSGSLAAVIRKLRAQFLLLAFVVLLPLVAYVGWLAFEERQNSLDAHSAEAHALAQDLVEAQQKLVADTRTLLRAIAITPVVRDPSSPECGRYLSALLPLEPNYVNLGVPRADGQLLCNALPLAGPVNVSDRPYIRRALDDRAFSISTFQVDRAVGQVTANFAYPVYDGAGDERPVAAAVAVVSLDWWNNALASAGLPPGSVAHVVDSEGTLLAHYPARPDLIGKPIAGAAFDPDGARRVYDQRALFDTDGPTVTMTIGIPVDAGIAQANARGLIRLAVLTLVVFAIWAIASRRFERSILLPLRIAQAELLDLEGDSGAAKRLLAKGALKHPEVGQFAQNVREIWQRGQLAQDAEKRAVRRMQALLSALPDLFFHLDREGRLLSFHSGDPANLYMPPEDFVGRRMQDVLPEGQAREFDLQVSRVRERDELMVWEYQLDIQGETKDFEARLCPVEGSSDVLLVIRDITARRQSERQRMEAEEQLQGVMQNIRGVVFTATVPADWSGPGPQDRVRFINPDVVPGIWEIAPDVLESNPAAGWDLCDDPDTAKALIDDLADSIRQARPWHSTWSITTPSGKRKWLEGYGNSTRLEDGGAQMVCMILDATEAVLQEQELEHQKELNRQAQKQQAIGQLTGGVAHDFNNLLAVIMGNLELLRDEETVPDRIAFIDASINATRRGADLTRSMLSFARKARLDPKSIRLNALVAETRSWAGRIMPENIEIETSLPADLWEIEADPSSTEAALLNLILNARDAMPGGGRLTIETANARIEESYTDSRKARISPGNYVMLAVSDTGEGIAPDALPRIFEPFYTTKPPGAGSGLGLSMIQGFMEQSGGTVQVYSEPGTGTTFKLYFPSRQAPAEPHPDPSVPDAPGIGQPADILLVEDEDEVRAVLAKITSKAGHRVTVAASGDEAFALFQARPGFDLVITDIVMPGKLQGTGLGKALRELRPDLPVIYMSGYASEATVHGNGLRAEDIRLMKPVQRHDLLAAISRALEP